MNKIVILGGWACSPHILRGLFSDSTLGDAIEYVDINPFMPFLIDKCSDIHSVAKVLRDCLDYIFDETNQRITLVGWSTGSLLACALANLVRPQKVILLSATPSFCRQKPINPYGAQPELVTTMIEELEIDRRETLRQFFVNCGIGLENVSPFLEQTDIYSTHELCAGLRFLRDFSLGQNFSLGCHAMIFHGKLDRIISYKAGEALAIFLKSEFVHVDNGHHCFFIDSSAQTSVRNKIATFLQEK